MFFAFIRAIATKLRVGTLHFALPDGRTLTFLGDQTPTPEATIIVKDYAFARRTIFGGDIGFFESFADGQWDTPDLSATLYLLALNVDHIQKAYGAAPIIGWFDQLLHKLNRNTKEGARRNIASHYDLGNEFYAQWLDPSMTYSSALYPSESGDLSNAQTNKYRALAESIELKTGESILEIGCGWGGFAEFAAGEVKAQVTGLTISKEQYDFAQERIFRAGLNEKVTLQLKDYRDADGAYDKIASIEMFEAVGREYWPVYFSKIRERLKPGGVAGVQTITIADKLFDHYQRSTDFIQKYVFPGGFLPSPPVLKREIENAGLSWQGARHFGQDYARTLVEWRQRFMTNWDDIRGLGFDDRFQNLWRFYLSYCEAGFRAGSTDVCQARLVRP